jgi:hypothetical protein
MSSEPEQYEHSVFLNCPFDLEYVSLFHAALFSIVDCGFIPRTALDVSDASEVRIHKIYATVGGCRLGIHDISRTQLDVATDLPRFNMPLELGIFLGAKFLGDTSQRRKACLVFDEKPYRYQMYLSDVAGQDISWHANDPRLLVLRIRDWLASFASKRLPSGSIIWDHFTTFMGELRYSCERLRQKPHELTYLDFLHHVRSFRQTYVETLTVEGDPAGTNPNPEDIVRAIRGIKPGKNAFVILGKGANGLSYIQAWLEKDGRWMVEYQDGHTEKHYQAEHRVDTGTLVRVFQAYAQGEDAWRTENAWRPQKV